MAIIRAHEHQDIFDVTLQTFGTLENLFDLLNDNGLNPNSGLTASQEITINNENKGEILPKSYFNKRNFVVMNADIFDLTNSHGDYNEDYNIDFFNT